MTHTHPPLALITGAHGFIGKHLALQLHQSGWRVQGLGHGLWPQEVAARWGVSHWLNGDISSGNLQQMLRLANRPPDVIFHLAGGSSVAAAITSPREDFARTVATTAELLDWIRLEAPASKIVAVSSAAVYGAGHQGPIDEHTQLNPFSVYGYHKMMMEQLCRSYGTTYGLQTVVARLFSVYGPELRKQLLWDLCSRLDRDAGSLTLGGSGAELRDWTEIRDVCRALERLAPLAAPEAPTFNVGTGRASSVHDVATTLVRHWAKATGAAREAKLDFTGQSRAGDPFSLVARSDRLAALGFSWETTTEDGLASYVNWYRAQNRQSA